MGGVRLVGGGGGGGGRESDNLHRFIKYSLDDAALVVGLCHTHCMVTSWTFQKSSFNNIHGR